MRLPEIDRGDSLGNRLLIGFISRVSGMRLPDAARVAFYHKAFFSAPMGAWTQRTMRGDSEWSVGERELMAALVAKWNSCPFCVGAHGAIAARILPRATVDAALADFEAADLSPKLKATLIFLEKLTLRPDQVTAADARAVYGSGVSRAALTDGVAVASVFAIITRYANALDFAMPTPAEFDKAGAMLLKRGYA
jgi:uncharacterized peroxidase-related enzyme